MRRFLPFLEWIPDYNKNWFSKDLVAGLTVGIILIPQGMAYAMIAGLPPVYGLYASLLPMIAYAVFGTSRQLAVGPVAMDSLLVAAGLATLAITSVDDYIGMALLLAFTVGAIQLTLGLLRMGFLVNFLSKPVISGFTSAAALIIMFSQLKHLLGVDITRSNRFDVLLVNAFEKMPDTNLYDFAIGLVGIVIIVALKKIDKRIPGILFVVILGILVVYLLQLPAFGVHIVGEIPTGLPSFRLHSFNVDALLELAPIAVTLALIGYLEAISIGKSLEEQTGEETIDANKELIALGSSNMLGSFFQSYVVTGSFSRSAINAQAGAKTPMALFFSAIVVAITLLFLTPLFYYLPNAVLASIIMVSVFGLIDIAYPKSLWEYRKDELFVLVITFLITLFAGISEGILIGVLLSLLLMVYKSSKPHFAVLGRIEGSDYYKNIDRFSQNVLVRDDLLIVRFDSQLYFGNKNYFKKELLKNVAKKGSKLKGIILNAEAISYIDSSAAQMLKRVIEEFHDKGLQFYISGATGPTRDTIFSSGIIDALNKKCLFVQTKEAVDYFDNMTPLSILSEKVACQNHRNSN
ncbi:solute carrier family 26 protein [Zobellia galactanivorans]|uniref:Sulfate transporter n=1 Tax=Zobellia galactanivorans (strain DSM 12802 / CCUG 47099 / CIP 106680 / NCIMB 13871 / Dsij) TaxID=63186 RepID=G0L667_ZOBGA|nr:MULTISPECIES: solute carrier family 26 protein [Zobellia]MDO6807011.1 solute carrier family 26 protein [Zobellia galactanivorans]OWW23918.1 sodium-independent anion transporter [Zobellia sp. OII3]CAZ96746.1 Sulfate transporter [Zobellia galactanivorans]